jgi:hypothetical protein
MVLRTSPAVVALLLLVAWRPAWASDTATERATLKGVKSVSVLVENISPEAERDGLTKSQITTDVELPLIRFGGRVSYGRSCGALFIFSSQARSQRSWRSSPP